MTHGWPGSVVELLGAVGPLTDPTAHGGRAEDAFDLVLPSIPGYGFSAEPTVLGWDSGRTARAWAVLHDPAWLRPLRPQGGDIAAITDAIGPPAPEGLIGIHMNLLSRPWPCRPAAGGIGCGTRGKLAAIATFNASGRGYSSARRPRTIGYGLWTHPWPGGLMLRGHEHRQLQDRHAFVDGRPTGGLTRNSMSSTTSR